MSMENPTKALVEEVVNALLGLPDPKLKTTPKPKETKDEGSILQQTINGLLNQL